jgi:hypothetical protein
MVHCSDYVDLVIVYVCYLQMAGLMVIHEEGWVCLARYGVVVAMVGGGIAQSRDGPLQPTGGPHNS